MTLSARIALLRTWATNTILWACYAATPAKKWLRFSLSSHWTHSARNRKCSYDNHNRKSDKRHQRYLGMASSVHFNALLIWQTLIPFDICITHFVSDQALPCEYDHFNYKEEAWNYPETECRDLQPSERSDYRWVVIELYTEHRDRWSDRLNRIPD